MLLALVLTAALFAVPAMAEGKTVIAAIEGDPQQMDPTLNSYSRSSKVLQNVRLWEGRIAEWMGIESMSTSASL